MFKKKALLIAEKPSLKRAIEEVYYKHIDEIPYDITFANFVGHVCTLASPAEYNNYDENWDIDRLPIIPTWNNYKVVIAKGMEEVAKNLNNVLINCQPTLIINACDPEREGENIFNLFKMKFLTNYKGSIKRFWCNALTEKDILNALLNLRDIDKNLKEASFCRAKSDWLIGMNFTEAITTMFSKGNSGIIKIGRVKTPLLRICYDRENAIRNFVPSSKYQIKSEYENGFTGTLFNDEGYIEFNTKEEAEKFMKNINNKQHTVLSCNKKQVSTKCPQLYQLSDIQIEAGRKYGYSANKVLDIIQSLYEKKYMSYPRTSLRYISTEEAKNIPIILENIAEVFPEYNDVITESLKRDITSILKYNNRICNDEEVSKAGHTALILTTIKPDLNKLSQEEINILKMVCIRLLSFLYEPLKEEKVEIITKSDEYTFKSIYRRLIDPGYTVLLDKKNEYLDIKNIKEKDTVNVSNIYPHEVKAVCPSRFTQADLVQIMENPIKYLYEESEENKKTLKSVKGIGTSATRAQIINSLFTDGYCEEIKSGKNKVIKVTDFGMDIMNLLHNTSFAQVDLTARWEQCLKLVETGNLTSDQYKRMIELYIRENISQIKELEGPSICSSEKLKKKCPCCNSNIIIGKKFYYCSNYSKEDNGCKFVMPFNLLGAKLTPKDVENLIDGKTIEKRLIKGNKTWDQSIKFKNNQLEFIKAKDKIIGKCPCCGKDVIKTSWGYGCSGFKTGCKFSISNVIASKKITDKVVSSLLENGISYKLSGFKSKTGNEFSARLILDKEDQKIKFSFE